MSIKVLAISALLLLFNIGVDGQLKKDGKMNLPKQLQKYIPKGYTLLDTAIGDLNLDKFPDVLLVLKAIGEENRSDTDNTARPLLLLIGHADKSYTLAGRNDDIVYCRDCGGVFGDPYAGIEIRNGTFTVNHFGGSNDRWSNAITFKYSATNKKWYLLKEVDKGWNVGNLEEIDSTIKTKKDFGIVSFEKYPPQSD